VQIVENVAYVLAGESSPTDSLEIIDVSDPATPSRLGSWSVGVSGFAKMQVVGKRVYFAAYGLRVVDVSDPAHPSLIGSYTAPDLAMGMQVDGDYVYIVSGLQLSGGWPPLPYAAQVQIFDLQNPVHPTVRGSYQYDVLWQVWDIQVVGHRAYLVGGTGGTPCYMYIVDVRIPTQPMLLSRYLVGGSAWSVRVVGNIAYIAAGYDGLQIVDVSDPVNLRLLGRYISIPVEGVEVVGNMAYIANSGGMQIIDVSNPLSPTLRGSYAGSLGWGSTVPVQVVDNLAYVTANSGGYGRLKIIDVTNSMTPTLRGTYATPGVATSVQVVGNLVYVTYMAGGSPNAGGGLAIIDISNPDRPILRGIANMPGRPTNVAVANNYAYIADLEGGLQIVDVLDPALPKLEHSYDVPGVWAWAVAVTDYLVYVSDYAAGLEIVWFAPPVSATIPSTGGDLRSTPDMTTYTFPTNTFTAPVMITHTARFASSVPATGELVNIGHTFEVTATWVMTGEAAFPSRPYHIAIQYSEDERGVAIENTLALYAWDGRLWMKEPSSKVNPMTNTITAMPDHLSLWTVLGETRRVSLPLVQR
jgi:hypothetical protein